MAARTAIGAAARSRPRKGKGWVRWIKRSILLVLTILCIVFIVGAFIFAGALQQAEQRLDNLPALMQRLELQPTTFYSSDGKVLYVVSNQYRLAVRYSDIPQVVRDAVVAAEDKRFWKHHGVDPEALAAIAADAMKDRKLRGGSTLSMQLAKRLYTSNERTLERKVNDMALAVAMERKLTKEQILEMYLNEVFFGSGAYGIKAAADVYFAKPLDKLTLGEAAMLARCVRRPTDENPFNDLPKALSNRNLVLRLMRDERLIDQKQYDKALEEKPKLNPKPPATTARVLRAPYFVRHVEQILNQDLAGIDWQAGGYEVYTTIDSSVQAAAEKSVRETVEKFRRNSVSTGAFVMMDTKGRILAEVGGSDFGKNEFNVVTQGHRQPGSSFKVVIYATALAQGEITANGSVSNERINRIDPGSQTAWNPKNSNGKYGGSVSVRTAFSYSFNLPAIHTLEKTGVSTVIDYAKNVFGINSPLPAVPSLGLGVGEVSPMEMAEAVSVFATGGDRVDPMAISRIVGPDGQVVRAYQPRIAAGVLDARVAEDMDGLMRLVVTNGTGKAAQVVPNARGKTGTTQENKDAWFIGYADGLIGVAWVGNEQRINGLPKYLPMGRKVYGGTVAVHIWNGAMKVAYPKFAVKLEKKNPDDVVVRTPFGEENPAATEGATTPAVPVPDPGTTPEQPGDQTVEEQPTDTENPAPNPDDPVEDPREEPREEPPPRRPDPPPIEYVDIEICADSRQVAGMYCPETVVRTFVKGQAPGKRCSTHGPH